MGALDGIRVLDFGRYIAGPYCATLLGDLGAEVIRIEKIDGGEDRWLSPVTSDGSGATFLNIGRNKLGLTLNPTKPDGREIVARLVATADVVVANLPRAGLQAIGLDYETLTAIKPDIILTTMDAYGDEGPYADRLGFDGVGQVMSGAAMLTGPLGQPTRSYVPYVDFGTASLAAFGTVSALYHRDRTGQGQHVQGALLRTALTFNAHTLTEEALTHKGRTSTHNRVQTAGPSDILQTKDGWFIIQIVGNPLFARLAKLLERDDWLEDERFMTDDGRGEYGEALSKALREWAGGLTLGEAIRALNEAGVPSAPVLDAAGALANEHIRAAGLFEATSYPGVEAEVPIVTNPLHLSATPSEIRHRAPSVGEHTDQILGDLGYTAGEIADLRERRVV